MLRGLGTILLTAILITGLAPEPATAGSVENRIVSQLKDQGFTNIQINRTWLGRSRIVAASPKYTREIVVNPATGAIMRDYWTEAEVDNTGNGLIDPESTSESGEDGGKGGSGNGGDGSGGGDGGHGGSGGDGGSGSGDSGGGSGGGGDHGGGDSGSGDSGGDSGGGNDD